MSIRKTLNMLIAAAIMTVSSGACNHLNRKYVGTDIVRVGNESFLADVYSCGGKQYDVELMQGDILNLKFNFGVMVSSNGWIDGYGLSDTAQQCKTGTGEKGYALGSKKECLSDKEIKKDLEPLLLRYIHIDNMNR